MNAEDGVNLRLAGLGDLVALRKADARLDVSEDTAADARDPMDVRERRTVPLPVPP